MVTRAPPETCALWGRSDLGAGGRTPPRRPERPSAAASNPSPSTVARDARSSARRRGRRIRNDGSKEEARTHDRRHEARARGDAGRARRERRYPARARRFGAFEPEPRAPMRAGRRGDGINDVTFQPSDRATQLSLRAVRRVRKAPLTDAQIWRRAPRRSPIHPRLARLRAMTISGMVPGYTAADAAVRLQRVQATCASLGLDAILFVGGVDGRDNLGSVHALNYLLGGVSGHELLERQQPVGSWAEDAVLLVRPTSCEIHLAPDAYDAVRPRIALWGDVRVHSLSPDASSPPRRPRMPPPPPRRAAARANPGTRTKTVPRTKTVSRTRPPRTRTTRKTTSWKILSSSRWCPCSRARTASASRAPPASRARAHPPARRRSVGRWSRRTASRASADPASSP